jgi:hypothetical protein
MTALTLKQQARATDCHWRYSGDCDRLGKGEIQVYDQR